MDKTTSKLHKRHSVVDRASALASTVLSVAMLIVSILGTRPCTQNRLKKPTRARAWTHNKLGGLSSTRKGTRGDEEAARSRPYGTTS